jgi:hypothetical protein
MKKILLSLAVVASISAFGQDDNGDLAGNLVTESGEGYNFNFNVTDVDSGWNADIANCASDSSYFNAFGNASASHKIDTFQVDNDASTRNGYLSFILETSVARKFISNRLPSPTCGSSSIDISGEDNKIIKARVSTTCDSLTFAILAASDDGGYQLHDASFDRQTVKSSDGWVELEFIVSDTSYNGSGELEETIGWAITVGEITNKGKLSFDWISIGDAEVVPSSKEELNIEGFKVYPNPSSDVLNIKFNANSETFVNLMDLTGKIVASQNAQVGAVTTAFQIADLNAGIYFVNVKSANGSATQKVVIK